MADIVEPRADLMTAIPETKGARLIYFCVTFAGGLAIARANDRGSMLRSARRRFGTMNEPITVEVADLPQLQAHLSGGAKFFEADLRTIVPPEEAYHRADLPLPRKFVAKAQGTP
jgi:hypothetical protein